MKTHVKFASTVPCLLMLATGCADVGSCAYTTTSGYTYCEDFLGNEYNQTVAQNTCSTNNGTWTDSNCSSSNSLGSCDVAVAEGTSQNVRYTYYAGVTSGTTGATVTTVQTACGVLGGVFTPAK